MDGLKVRFRKTTSVKMHCPHLDYDWRRDISRPKGEINCSDDNEEDVWRLIHSRKDFSGPVINLIKYSWGHDLCSSSWERMGEDFAN